MDSIFRSARLKLTLFYLIILVGMSLTLTFSFRLLAEHEYARSSSAQYGQMHHYFVAYPWDVNSDNSSDAPPVRPDVAFVHIQNNEESAARARLNRDFIFVNLAALVIGGVLSYWFAGRTLKPIEEAHASQARFAADASHELRTPLASMQVENEVFLRQKSFTEAEARAQIESNLEEVQRLEHLSTSLLALTQYDQTTLLLKPTDVQAVVNEAITHIRPMAASKHVQFKHDVPEQSILVNQESLVQLLSIVLENAVKYGPEKGMVTVTGHRHASHYLIDVIDEGAGISDADLPHIFERLYRGDKARNSKAGGYGLGLALAQQIAKANHAVITAANNEKGGAQFTIQLDIVK